MSRTRHHRGQRNQNAGRDLWSRRPCAGMSHDAENKRLTRRIERARKKSETERDWKESS